VPTTPSNIACQTCPISALSFTWPPLSYDGSIVQYAPQVSLSIDQVTNCAQLELDCTCGNVRESYIIQYSEGNFNGEYSSNENIPFLGCNPTTQLWQNNYLSPNICPITVTNFICYRENNGPCPPPSYVY
jgi:hypothetical protein